MKNFETAYEFKFPFVVLGKRKNEGNWIKKWKNVWSRTGKVSLSLSFAHIRKTQALNMLSLYDFVLYSLDIDSESDFGLGLG